MANTIIIKKSSTAGAVPAAASLQPGELAVNLADRKLYSKTTGGSVVEVGNGAVAAHTHVIGDVTGLQTALDGKAALSHTHTIANVTGLQSALDGKAALSHTHTIANVTGLQSALDGKLNLTGGTLTGGLTVAYSGAPAVQVGSTAALTEPRVRLVNSNWTTGTDFVASATSGSKGYGFYNRDRSAWDLQVEGNSGVVSGSFSGSLAGNASTATKLQTARTISLGGDATGSVSFDGSANVTLTATVADDSHNHIIGNVDGLQTALNLKLNAANGVLTGVTTYATMNAAGANSRDKLRVWNSSTYAIGMSNAFTFGDLGSDGYAMTFQMSGAEQRGFWWGTSSHTTAQGAMSLSNRGRLTVAESVRVGYGTSDTTDHDTGFDLDIQGPARVQGVDLVSTLNAKAPIASPSFTTAVNSPRYNVGDDAYFADINAANTVAVRGAQNADVGFINFGPGGNALGSGSGQALTFRSGGVAYHGSSTYGSAKITVSTSSPSGGVSGDIWLKV